MLLNPGLVFGMNTFNDRFHCRCGSSVVSKDSKGLFRPEHFSRRKFAAETACPAQSLCFGQEGSTASQFLFCFLAVVNVSQQHVPAGDTTFRVSGGKGARVEPAVDAIGTSLAEFKIMRLPGFDRAPPRVDHARKVIRMDGVAGGPILQVLGRLAKIVQDLAVKKFDFACRTQGTYKPGNGV